MKDYKQTAKDLERYDKFLKSAMLVTAGLTMLRTKRLGPIAATYSSYLSGMRWWYLEKHEGALKFANVSKVNDPYPGFFGDSKLAKSASQQSKQLYDEAYSKYEEGGAKEAVDEFIDKLWSRKP